MPTPCPHRGRDLGSSSSVSPGTPLPPPRVAVPGERRRAGSVSWGAVSLFVRPPAPHCAQRSRGWRKKSPAACPLHRAPQGDPTLPSRAAPAVPPQCASTSPAPHPGVGQVKAIYLSTCGAARYPAPHSTFWMPKASAGASRSSRWPGWRRAAPGTSPEHPRSAPGGCAHRWLV